ncbi:MAG: polymerase epsilon subunit [Bacteroidetes bacterium]|nr:polymerase epsilon subunit [Bacteroidota bacterium]
MTELQKYNLPWWQSSFIILDLEGTGSQHKELEGIVEIAAIELSGKQLTSNYYYKLINPQIEIPPMISKIHGLKNKDLENEPDFSVIREGLFDFINGKILVGHNVSVDYRVLKLKMPDYCPLLILDTKKISKHFWGSEPKHGLDELIERFGIKDQLTDLPVKRNRHSAYYDAYATGLVFLKMIEEKLSDETTLSALANICSINPESDKKSQGSLF